jgi:polysaccharide pyruvyl transferase WcaK-like protein
MAQNDKPISVEHLQRSSETASHFVVIGDVSNISTYHVGDEAMLNANLSEIRKYFPNTTFTVLSHDPTWTSNHYRVASIPRLNFPNTPNAHDLKAQLEELLGNVQVFLDSGDLSSKQFGSEVISALAASNGLIISGGGNICSTWPGFLYERVGLMRIAQMLGKRIVILGQTIGPYLQPDEMELLKDTLPYAEMIGIREQSTVELLTSLGIPEEKIKFQLDDAFYLGPQVIEAIPTITELLNTQRSWIAITIHPFCDPNQNNGVLEALARQLDKVVETTGMPLVFIPHVATTQNSGLFSDSMVGQALARFLKPTTPMTVLDVYLDREVYWVTSQAAMIISSRYHPLIFALATGIPCLGIYTDEYSRVKVRGALAHAGLEDWAIPLELALVNLLERSAVDLWSMRVEIRQHLSTMQGYWQALFKRHWQYVYSVLGLITNQHQDDRELTSEVDRVMIPPSRHVQPPRRWAE